MRPNKQVNIAPSQAGPECCMCGDFGLSSELFPCKICRFRSQHRYCSNLYPKAESYEICNWCMSQKEDKEKSHNSSNSSSNKKTNSEDSNRTRRNTQKSPERSPSTRRRIITNGALEEKLRRTRSKEVSNRVIAKPVYRNKVRRYKLLDEVSS